MTLAVQQQRRASPLTSTCITQWAAAVYLSSAALSMVIPCFGECESNNGYGNTSSLLLGKRSAGKAVSTNALLY
jgi:hypothetical protein